MRQNTSAFKTRFVLLDAAVQRASVSGAEPGMDLLWRARGASGMQTLRFERRASLPWQPCHLRVRGGVASWLRRGPDIADSWTVPETPNIGRFLAEFDTGSGFGSALELDAAACVVPAGTIAIRIAEVGPDGRRGEWLSIGPGSPYL